MKPIQPVQSPCDLRPTLVYCRESRDEYQAEYERIETQREMLLTFCKKRGLTNIVDIVLDDGKSGTSFQRFDHILPRFQQGELRVLVCKDASRLGRNLKESLIFVEQLEEWGAEILFESEEYNEDFFPLKAWFNEQRAKEDSRKIRRVLRYKMETGELLIKPCYGYRCSPAGTLVPDPTTAPVVAEVFRWAGAGVSAGEIAGRLNAQGLPTPSQSAGLSRCAAAWNRQHIRRMLANPVYVGTMVYNRTGRKSFKNKQTIRKPETEWVTVPQHHPPLVTPEQFAAAQMSRLQTKQHSFSGLLFCGRCGRKLVYRGGKDRPASYLCGTYRREGAVRPGKDGGCTPHRVPEDFLWKTIASRLQNWIQLEEFLEIRQNSLEKNTVSGAVWMQKHLTENRLDDIMKILDDQMVLQTPPFLYRIEVYEPGEFQQADGVANARHLTETGGLLFRTGGTDAHPTGVGVSWDRGPSTSI